MTATFATAVTMPQGEAEAAELRALVLATPADQLAPLVMRLDIAWTNGTTDWDIAFADKAECIAALEDFKRLADIMILAHERRTYDPDTADYN